MIENIMIKEHIQSNSEINLLLKLLPKYAIVLITEDGYYHIEIDLNSPVKALEKVLENTATKPISVATNGIIDNVFKKLCQERGIEIIGF